MKIALGLTVLVLASGCGKTYTYEADPIDGREECFNIEREEETWNKDSNEEVNLGSYCRGNRNSLGVDE